METKQDALTIDYRDPFGVYRLVEPDIKRNLPLQNLHWHLPPRPLRSIPILRINLVEDSPQHDPVAVKHQFAGLQVSPFVRLMVVQCDDLEIYRSTVRPIIREWLSTQVTPNKDQTEWLLIQVIPQDAQSGGSSSRHLHNGTTPRFKTKIFDKIKSDFNESSSEDRCFQIKLDQPPADLEKSYNQLMVHIRDLVLEALSKRVRLYEEGMRKLEDQRLVPGWNFGAFFVTKEGLALSFTRISLLDDALALYDELEAMFLDLSSEKTSFLLSETGAPLPQSQSSKPFTAILEDKNVRSKIADNTITYFDFRVYLFSSQYSILKSIVRSRPPAVQALRVSELLFRARDFLTSVITILENEGVSTSLLYPWACGVVDTVLDDLIIDEDSKGIQDISDGRAELILLKRHALEMLGRIRGWHISSLGVMDTVSLDDDLDGEDKSVGHENDGDDLFQSLAPRYKDLLDTQVSFIEGFTDITLQALRESEIADRIRLSDSLKSELAVLYYDQKRYSEAAELLNNLPKLYLSQGWDILSSSLQWIYSQCLYKLKDYKEYISAAFDLLRQSTPTNRTYVKLLFDQLEPLVRESSMVNAVVSISGLVQEVIDPYIDFSDDGVFPTMNISFACNFDHWSCDSIELILASTEIPNRTTSFQSRESESISISRSNSVYKLYSKTFVLGNFRPRTLRLKYGSVVLEKVFEIAPVISVFPPPECLSVDIGVPRAISLEEGGKITVDIESPTSGFESATLKIRGSTAGLRMFTGPIVHYKKCGDTFEEIESHSDVSEVLEVGQLPKHSIIRIVIPYTMEKELADIKINWELHWITQDNQKMSMLDTCLVPVSLPISVNVQDVFRAHNLFSKFSVSCVDEIGPVRVLSLHLGENSTFKGETGPASTKEILSFPSLATNYAFRVFRKEDAPSSEPSPRTLNLVITYSVLNEEIVTALETLVARKLSENNLLKYLRLILPAFTKLKYDTMAYGMTGEISLNESFNIGSWEERLRFINEEDAIKLLKVMNGIFKSPKPLKYGSEVEHALREITIPVEIPCIHVLHTVDLCLSHYETSNDEKLKADFQWTVGEPVQAKVKIQSTRAWSGVAENEAIANVEFSYEILGDSETWLIVGPKRGHVPLKDSLDGQCYTFNISLIPLRPGHWLLPTIGIAPFGPDAANISMETDYLANGIVAFVQTSNQSTSFTIDFSAPPKW